jgi:drug/metabolite transporter (DMT)-like permease
MRRQFVLGGLLVFGSAISYALYLLYTGEAVKRLGALRVTGVATSLASLICIAQFFTLRPVSAIPNPGIGERCVLSLSTAQNC